MGQCGYQLGSASADEEGVEVGIKGRPWPVFLNHFLLPDYLFSSQFQSSLTAGTWSWPRFTYLSLLTIKLDPAYHNYFTTSYNPKTSSLLYNHLLTPPSSIFAPNSIQDACYSNPLPSSDLLSTCHHAWKASFQASGRLPSAVRSCRRLATTAWLQRQYLSRAILDIRLRQQQQ